MPSNNLEFNIDDFLIVQITNIAKFHGTDSTWVTDRTNELNVFISDQLKKNSNLDAQILKSQVSKILGTFLNSKYSDKVAENRNERKKIGRKIKKMMESSLKDTIVNVFNMFRGKGLSAQNVYISELITICRYGTKNIPILPNTGLANKSEHRLVDIINSISELFFKLRVVDTKYQDYETTTNRLKKTYFSQNAYALPGRGQSTEAFSSARNTNTKSGTNSSPG